VAKIICCCTRTNQLKECLDCSDNVELIVKCFGRKNSTKRETLRFKMTVYYPLGCLAPITIKVKIIMQQMWRSGIGWDDELPPEVNKQRRLSHVDIQDACIRSSILGGLYIYRINLIIAIIFTFSNRDSKDKNKRKCFLIRILVVVVANNFQRSIIVLLMSDNLLYIYHFNLYIVRIKGDRRSIVNK
jgi:hypothetical protein